MAVAKVRLGLGDVRARLQLLDPNSVDCVVTSPPYFGLRAGSKAMQQIWGGQPACRHEWTQHATRAVSGGTRTPKLKIKGSENFQTVPAQPFAACRRCGAWYGALGSEPTVDLYVAHLVEVFDRVRVVLKPSGTVWVNLGDSYSTNGKWGGASSGKHVNGRTPRVRRSDGGKPKDLLGVPYRFALAMQAAGWYWRSLIIWHKPNALPHPVKDRPNVDFETILLFTRSPRYFYNWKAMQEQATGEGNGNKRRLLNHQPEHRTNFKIGVPWQGADVRRGRAVWSFPTVPYKNGHFSTFPPELPRRCISAGCPAGGTVLDPFAGTGTTLQVAREMGRAAIGIEIEPRYVPMIAERLGISLNHIIRE